MKNRPAIFLILNYLTDGATDVLEQFFSSASMNNGPYNGIEQYDTRKTGTYYFKCLIKK